MFLDLNNELLAGKFKAKGRRVNSAEALRSPLSEDTITVCANKKGGSAVAPGSHSLRDSDSLEFVAKVQVRQTHQPTNSGKWNPVDGI